MMGPARFGRESAWIERLCPDTGHGVMFTGCVLRWTICIHRFPVFESRYGTQYLAVKETGNTNIYDSIEDIGTPERWCRFCGDNLYKRRRNIGSGFGCKCFRDKDTMVENILFAVSFLQKDEW